MSQNRNQISIMRQPFFYFKNGRLSGGIVERFLNQLIIKLSKLGEIQYENIFIDGTKIEAYANKYTFVWKKTTLKDEQRMQEKAKIFLCLAKLAQDLQTAVSHFRV